MRLRKRNIYCIKIWCAFLTQQVVIEWNSIYEPNVKTFYCSVSALSETPDLIKHITLNELTVSQNSFMFKVIISWDKPDSFNGAFLKYEIAVGPDVLALDLDEVPSGWFKEDITSVSSNLAMLMCMLIFP